MIMEKSFAPVVKGMIPLISGQFTDRTETPPEPITPEAQLLRSGSNSQSGALGQNSPAEPEEDLLKDKNWTGAAQDGERLASEERVGHACQGGSKQRLHGALAERGEGEGDSWPSQLVSSVHGHHDASYYVSSGGLAQQAAEGDDGRHAGAVKKEDGRHTLETGGVSDVTPQEGNLPPNVHQQTTEHPTVATTTLIIISLFSTDHLKRFEICHHR